MRQRITRNGQWGLSIPYIVACAKQEYGGAVPEKFRPLEVAQYWENEESVGVLKVKCCVNMAIRAPLTVLVRLRCDLDVLRRLGVCRLAVQVVAEARMAFQAAVTAGDVEVVKRMLEQQCHESESVIDVAASVREVRARAPAR